MSHDHCVTGRSIYSVSELLTISILTYLCDDENYMNMSEFAHVSAKNFCLQSGNNTSPSVYDRKKHYSGFRFAGHIAYRA